MYKRYICLATVILLLFATLSGCEQADDPTFQPYDSAYYNVSQFYLQYMECAMDERAKAAEFCYFVDEENRNLYCEDDPITSYEIIRVEKLSDFLWVIEIFFTDSMYLNGTYGVNYVGIVDGEMLVYRNESHIPASLTEGIEIEDYYSNGPDIVG